MWIFSEKTEGKAFEQAGNIPPACLTWVLVSKLTIPGRQIKKPRSSPDVLSNHHSDRNYLTMVTCWSIQPLIVSRNPGTKSFFNDPYSDGLPVFAVRNK